MLAARTPTALRNIIISTLIAPTINRAPKSQEAFRYASDIMFFSEDNACADNPDRLTFYQDFSLSVFVIDHCHSSKHAQYHEFLKLIPMIKVSQGIAYIFSAKRCDWDSQAAGPGWKLLGGSRSLWCSRCFDNLAEFHEYWRTWGITTYMAEMIYNQIFLLLSWWSSKFTYRTWRISWFHWRLYLARNDGDQH